MLITQNTFLSESPTTTKCPCIVFKVHEKQTAPSSDSHLVSASCPIHTVLDGGLSWSPDQTLIAGFTSGSARRNMFEGMISSYPTWVAALLD